MLHKIKEKKIMLHKNKRKKIKTTLTSLMNVK